LVIPKSGHNGGKKGIGRILLFGIQELRKGKKEKWKEKWRERKKERKKEIKEENKSKKSF